MNTNSRLVFLLGFTMILMAAAVGFSAVPGRPDRDKVAFAYLQSPTTTDIRGVRWGALTHIGWSFVTFNSSAALSGVTTFNSRSAELKPGGVAANSGVKVILVLANGNTFDETILDTVMTSATLRTTLINNVVSVVGNPTNGCDGVNLDFEFSWGTTTRNGMMTFIQDLNAALKALNPPRELSMYTLPSWSSTQYSATTLRDHMDYVIYSGYDFASGNTMSSIGRYGNPATYSIVGNVDDYIAAGIPPDHLVIALPFYCRYWTTDATGVYGDVGSSPVPDSLVQTNFDTTWRNPPLAKFASTPADHYGRWYKRDMGAGVYRLYTFDDQNTLETKFRLINSWQGNQRTGSQLRGIAFWSLLWMVEGTSVDPNNTAAGGQSLTRTIGFPYTLMEEMYAPAGMREFRAETFEQISGETSTGYNARWREPEDGPDDQNVDAAISTRAPAAAPAGAPAGSNEVLAVTFRFTATPNRFFFKHQPLMGTETPYAVDWNNALVLTDNTTKFDADIHVPAGYAGTTIRMVVRDSLNQLEKGPAFPLTTSGWRRISFDLQNDTVTAYTTAEAAYSSGNGVINTAGSGARDVAFAGFEVSSTGFTGATGTINFDKITYTDAQPGNRRYVVNEFRSPSATQQFVEIQGPAGTMPAGLQLRVVNGWDGAVVGSPVALGGNTIPASGLYLVGASGLSAVRNQAMTDGLMLSSSSTTVAQALQLFDTATGTVHDSVVYRAFEGVYRLDGPDDPVVTRNGAPWFGEIASGGDVSAVPYSAGRYPDGSNTWVNGADFTFMPASPGQPNGASITLPASFDFTSAPPRAFRSFGNFSVQAPDAAVGASPNGGNVHRCVDTAGGGAMSVIGDAALGAGNAGYNATGQVFVPANATGAGDTHATGIGICGRSGSSFFGSISPVPGYESGYWLIYENGAGVGLADDRPDHAGTFEFVHATSTDAYSTRTVLLGSKTLAQLGVTAGSWRTFRLQVNPAAAAGEQLIAQINGVDVYRGAIPAGGPVSGAFQVGFRENHSGAPLAREGTWIDALSITAPPAAGVEEWRGM